MLEEDPQAEEIIARVAALDIGKAEVVCCVRVPHEGRPGRRLQEVQTYSAVTRRLLAETLSFGFVCGPASFRPGRFGSCGT